MRPKVDCFIITFDTTSHAIAMEKYCKEHQIKGRLIPIPATISAGCGICWKMTEEDYMSNQSQIQKIDYKEIHYIKL